MPCRVDVPPEPTVSVKSHAATKGQVTKLKKRNQLLEAALCAIGHELTRNGLYDGVIDNAAANGDIDIRKIMDEHKKADKERLGKLVENLSKDEREMLKEIIG